VIPELIEHLGLVVPRDVAYVDLGLDQFDHNVAGMRQNYEIAGEVATAMLVTHIQQNLRGIPAVATATMVDGTWVDGASLPMAASSGSRSGKLKTSADFVVENTLLASA
jgi:LacI family transcriptional regulator